MIIATYRTPLTIDPRPEHFGVHEYSGALLFKPPKRVPGYLHYYSRQTVTKRCSWRRESSCPNTTTRGSASSTSP